MHPNCLQVIFESLPPFNPANLGSNFTTGSSTPFNSPLSTACRFRTLMIDFFTEAAYLDRFEYPH